MTPILLIPPSVEPISLAQAKAWLRVTAADEDELIAGLVISARTLVERATRTMLLAQTWRLVMDEWPSDGFTIPLAPFRSLSGLRTFSSAGVATLAPAASYVVDPNPGAARVRFLTPPAAPGCIIAGAEVDVVVGFATAPEGVPEPLRQAVRLLVARWFEQRGDADSEAGLDRLPPLAASLLAPYRRMRLA